MDVLKRTTECNTLPLTQEQKDFLVKELKPFSELHHNEKDNQTIIERRCSNTNHTVKQQLLQIISPKGEITISDCEEILNYTKKEEKLKNACDLSKIKMRPDDGRFYLIVKRKPISSTNYIGLIDKLFEHFFGTLNVTMEQYFEVWMV